MSASPTTSAREKILESALSGAVVALYGKCGAWARPPKKFRCALMCKEIYDGLRAPQDGAD